MELVAFYALRKCQIVIYLIISVLVHLMALRMHDYDTVTVRFFTGVGGRRSADELNAFIGEVYFSFLIEFSGGHLEGLFAHAEEGVDGFGVGFVMVGEVPFVFLKQAEDFGGGVFYAIVAGTAGGDVDLGLAGWGLGGGEDIFYKAGKAVADFYVAVDFIKVEDTGMEVVDDDDIADVGAAVDGEVDEVVVFYGEVIVTEKGFDLFGGGEAAGLFIEVYLYEIVTAEAHAA